MHEVSSISETTDAGSAKALAGADEVGRDADTLRDEVTQFLQTMASENEEDRRRYEQVLGNGAEPPVPERKPVRPLPRASPSRAPLPFPRACPLHCGQQLPHRLHVAYERPVLARLRVLVRHPEQK